MTSDSRGSRGAAPDAGAPACRGQGRRCPARVRPAGRLRPGHDEDGDGFMGHDEDGDGFMGGDGMMPQDGTAPQDGTLTPQG